MGKATLVRAGAVAAAGAAVGLGVNALGSAGADTQTGTGDRAGAHVRPALFGHARYGRHYGLRRAVHAEAVFPFEGKFVTVSVDRGRVEKVDGDDLTLREGTPRLTYKTVTLTIPDNAVVRLNRQAAKLSDLQAGDKVAVLHGLERTAVRAHRR
jgi:hypothetical protein